MVDTYFDFFFLKLLFLIIFLHLLILIIIHLMHLCNDILNTFCMWLYWYMSYEKKRKEGNILFNHALNTFYLRLYGVGHMVNDHSEIVREETHFCHIGYSFRLTTRILLYAPSNRQVSTYHGLCYTSSGTLAGT